ncbi:expressed unknown protein [Seminavis robusta]|uniref:Uncharacterized protein n=1 Tax=Seminavis robusta TaxID=568900 RepID=A0A9N8EJI3_9STRA|nr:expressed unknown protein [Seminavis robusta]|eukprot:Sro1087_g239790.1 n/a (765) ;mRNA; f:1061-3355
MSPASLRRRLICKAHHRQKRLSFLDHDDNDDDNDVKERRNQHYSKVRIRTLPLSDEEDSYVVSVKRRLPVTLGRVNLSTWWWRACPHCSQEFTSEDRRNKYWAPSSPCRNRCRPLAKHVRDISKEMIYVNETGEIDVLGLKPEIVHISATKKGDGRKTVSIGDNARDPWVKFQLEFIAEQSTGQGDSPAANNKSTTNGRNKRKREPEEEDSLSSPASQPTKKSKQSAGRQTQQQSARQRTNHRMFESQSSQEDSPPAMWQTRRKDPSPCRKSKQQHRCERHEKQTKKRLLSLSQSSREESSEPTPPNSAIADYLETRDYKELSVEDTITKRQPRRREPKKRSLQSPRSSCHQWESSNHLTAHQRSTTTAKPKSDHHLRPRALPFSQPRSLQSSHHSESCMDQRVSSSSRQTATKPRAREADTQVGIKVASSNSLHPRTQTNDPISQQLTTKSQRLSTKSQRLSTKSQRSVLPERQDGSRLASSSLCPRTQTNDPISQLLSTKPHRSVVSQRPSKEQTAPVENPGTQQQEPYCQQSSGENDFFTPRDTAPPPSDTQQEEPKRSKGEDEQSSASTLNQEGGPVLPKTSLFLLGQSSAESSGINSQSNGCQSQPRQSPGNPRGQHEDVDDQQDVLPSFVLPGAGSSESNSNVMRECASQPAADTEQDNGIVALTRQPSCDGSDSSSVLSLPTGDKVLSTQTSVVVMHNGMLSQQHSQRAKVHVGNTQQAATCKATRALMKIITEKNKEDDESFWRYAPLDGCSRRRL